MGICRMGICRLTTQFIENSLKKTELEMLLPESRAIHFLAKFKSADYKV